MRHGALFLVSMSLASAGLGQQEAMVKVGDRAPEFRLSDATGKTYDLAEFRGKNAVVLEFFRSGDW